MRPSRMRCHLDASKPDPDYKRRLPLTSIPAQGCLVGTERSVSEQCGRTARERRCIALDYPRVRARSN
jgi:hypothetical protein